MVGGISFTQNKITAAHESAIHLRVLSVHQLLTLADELRHLTDAPLHSLFEHVVYALGSVVRPASARRLHILS